MQFSIGASIFVAKKMKYVLPSLITVFSFLTFSSVYSQDSTRPAVFQLGGNEQLYNDLAQEYSQTLLEAAGNDLQLAFNHWLDLMVKVESYAEQIKYDVNGIKLWLHVFFNADGSVEHIGYLLRDDSKNVDTSELSAFFKSFYNKGNKIAVTSSKNFSFYTGVTFPTYVQKASGN